MGRRPNVSGPRLSTQRLLVRENDMILSASARSVSVVTRLVPNALLLAGGPNVFLASRDREQIEQLLGTGEVSVLTAQPESGLEQAPAEERASHILSVHNSLLQKTKTLIFYRHDPDRPTHCQADFKRDEFTPEWTTAVPAHWGADVRQGWLDEWFATLGRFNQIIRPNNAVLVLKVLPRKFEIVFNRQDGAEGPSVSFPFRKAIKVPAGADQTAYFSKDLAPVLFNLADAEVDGDIVIAGNRHALVFRYRSPVGRFEIAVPTLSDDEAQRDATLFHRWPAAKI